MKTLTFIDDTTVEIDGEVFRKDVPPEPAPKPSKPEFKVGDWVIRTVEAGHPHHIDKVFRITDIVDNGLKEDEITHMVSSCRLATPSEIESHLTTEADRRGFKEGVRYQGLFGWHKTPQVREGKLNYYVRGDTEYLTDGNGDAIYKNGKWAEILPDKKPLPQTRDEYGKMIKAYFDSNYDTEMPFVTPIYEFLDDYDFKD